jgi:hypothetical protein
MDSGTTDHITSELETSTMVVNRFMQKMVQVWRLTILVVEFC